MINTVCIFGGLSESTIGTFVLNTLKRDFEVVNLSKNEPELAVLRAMECYDSKILDVVKMDWVEKG